MSPNHIHNFRRRLAGLVISMGLFCLAISGTAAQWGDWTYAVSGGNVTITGYTGVVAKVDIPSSILGYTVKAIGVSAFRTNLVVADVTIPDSVLNIGNYGFYGCANLTNVTLGNSITNIGYTVFFDCKNLASVVIPDSVITLLDNGFYGCTNLASATIGKKVTRISPHLFQDCRTLTKVVIPDSVTSIGDNAFYGCMILKGISLANTITNMGKWTFAYCSSLTNVVLPDSITSIKEYFFYRCYQLSRVTVGRNVSSIESNAFLLADGLTGVYFKDTPPVSATTAFDVNSIATVYYYPWTSGWTDTYGGRPTAINPDYIQWLNNCGFTTNLANDSDTDGMLNWQEYLAGTNPTNDNDRLAITSITNLSLISWQAKSNVSYQVMKNWDLMAAWSNAPSGSGTNQQAFKTAPMDGVMHYADPSGVGISNTFYRVNVVP